VASDINVPALAAATEGCVGADIAGLCRLAALAALARDPVTTQPHVSAADFVVALREQQEGRAWRQ
jgi:ATP-dependent 26S proteasome regulatory subunit